MMEGTLRAEDDWPPMPAPHRARLRAILDRLRRHESLLGLLAGGSFAGGRLDAYSDLDLVVVVAPGAWERVLAERQALAAQCGPLLAAFTGEHVGEPRLLICLFGPPPVHVDLKFVTPDQLASRVEDPFVLWARDERVAAGLAAGQASYPQPDLQWIEDRFWVWVHYAATKVGRGELFEALDGCAFLRSRVLGPLALQLAGARANGVRRLEAVAAADARAMERAVASYEARDIARAIVACVERYRSLRDRTAGPSLERRARAEEVAIAYLEDIVATLADEA